MKSYEALPFLNNVGITLLERRQFKESVETFADAVVLHRSTIAALHMSDKSDGETLDDLLTQEALRRASTRLARVYVPTSNNMTYLSLDPFMVLDLANANCMSSILKFGTDIDQIDFVVRMNQEADNDFVSDNRKVKLDSAILFLNYGVACKRASGMIDFSSNENIRDELREQSMKLFDLSNQIVQIEINCLYNAIQCHDKEILIVEHYLEIALMISMFTSSHISECMYWQHSIEDGVKYYTNFEESFKSFRTISTEKISSLSKSHAASA